MRRPRNNARTDRAQDWIRRQLGRVRRLTGWSTTEGLNATVIQARIVAGEHGPGRACDTKVKFSRYDRAKKAADDLSQTHGKRMSVYPCPFCVCFHLASAGKTATRPDPVEAQCSA